MAELPQLSSSLERTRPSQWMTGCQALKGQLLGIDGPPLTSECSSQRMQEWRLFTQSEQQDYATTVDALCAQLDPGSKTMAAQKFCHSLQKNGGVPDYVRRLEKTLQIAYEKDDLGRTTRDTLLYGQLYEGLRYELVQSAAVSGAQSYQELCTAATPPPQDKCTSYTTSTHPPFL